MIEHLIGGGVHGLFFLGSTSEVVFHDEATRDRILEHAVAVVAGRLPVLAGVVDPTTERVIGHARRAAAIGVDAVVVTAPFYTRTSAAETVEHFRYVADGSPVPVVAYDLPVSVHSKLSRDTVTTLAREGAIVGLKDSSGDGGGLRYVISDMADRPDFFCMTGGELDVDAALLMGAHGQRGPSRLCAAVSGGAAGQLGGGAGRAGAAVPAVRDRVVRGAAHQCRGERRGWVQDGDAGDGDHRGQYDGAAAAKFECRGSGAGGGDLARGGVVVGDAANGTFLEWNVLSKLFLSSFGADCRREHDAGCQERTRPWPNKSASLMATPTNIPWRSGVQSSARCFSTG